MFTNSNLSNPNLPVAGALGHQEADGSSLEFAASQPDHINGLAAANLPVQPSARTTATLIMTNRNHQSLAQVRAQYYNSQEITYVNMANGERFASAMPDFNQNNLICIEQHSTTLPALAICDSRGLARCANTNAAAKCQMPFGPADEFAESATHQDGAGVPPTRRPCQTAGDAVQPRLNPNYGSNSAVGGPAEAARDPNEKRKRAKRGERKERGLAAWMAAREHNSHNCQPARQTFACPTCSRQFTEKFNMKRHMQVHSQPRPKYACDACSKTFSWRDNFTRHRKAVHSRPI